MPALLHPFAKPAASAESFLRLVRGEGAVVYDEDGTPYLDAMASLWHCNVGHSRPEVAAAVAEQLATLEGMGGRGSRRGGRRASAPEGSPARRRRVAISPKVRALRRLQGKYMGYVRRLKPAEKARVRTVREKQGMQAAIRLASSLAKSS